jgi:hypothetical protein
MYRDAALHGWDRDINPVLRAFDLRQAREAGSG